MKDILTAPTASGAKRQSRQQESGKLPSYPEILENDLQMNQRRPTEWTQILDWNYLYQDPQKVRLRLHQPHRHLQPLQETAADSDLRILQDSVVEPEAKKFSGSDLVEHRLKVMNFPL